MDFLTGVKDIKRFCHCHLTFSSSRLFKIFNHSDRIRLLTPFDFMTNQRFT